VAEAPLPTKAERREVLIDAASIGLATGVYGISFGALAVTSKFTVAQTSALSLLMFTGASQFALVGIVGAAGGAAAAIGTAWMLGARNGLYALRMAELLAPRGWKRLAAAQLTIDESTGLAVRNDDGRHRSLARLGFWAAGIAVFVCWNIATILGALAANALGDPRHFGLDAAIPAAFLALLWPRLSDRTARGVGLGAAVMAIALTPFLRPGLPVLLSAIVAVVVGLWPARKAPTDDATEGAIT
jgi:predicted branched-subunit amino acid permease